MSLSTALSTAMQQVSTLRQAEIGSQIAEEDVRQAQAALLPRARDSSRSPTIRVAREARSEFHRSITQSTNIRICWASLVI